MTFGREGPLSAESEQELMRQLVAGEEHAIRTLYSRFGRPIYTVGLRMLGSVEAAEELTQDVFLAAWRKGGRFDSERGLGEITGADGATYAFHSTAIADGSRAIAVGTAVEFDVTAGHLGRWEASAIVAA